MPSLNSINHAILSHGLEYIAYMYRPFTFYFEGGIVMTFSWSVRNILPEKYLYVACKTSEVNTKLACHEKNKNPATLCAVSMCWCVCLCAWTHRLWVPVAMCRCTLDDGLRQSAVCILITAPTPLPRHLMRSDARRLMAINNAHGGRIWQPALSSGTMGVSLQEAFCRRMASISYLMRNKSREDLPLTRCQTSLVQVYGWVSSSHLMCNA